MKKIIKIDNTNTGDGVSYKIGLVADQIRLIFQTNIHHIYRTSNYETILRPPREIILDLNKENLLTMISCMSFSISKFLSDREDFIKIDNQLISENKQKVILKVPLDRERKEKIIIDIYDAQKKQIISFGLAKTKIVLLLMMMKETSEKLHINDHNFDVYNSAYKFRIVRNDNNIAINGIWLRNTEVEMLRYLVDVIIFNFKANETLKEFQKIHRQVMIIMNPNSDKLVIALNKYGKNKETAHFYINTRIISALHLSLCSQINFKGDYLNEF